MDLDCQFCISLPHRRTNQAVLGSPIFGLLSFYLDLMEHKALLRFLILFLGLSYVLSSRLLPDQSAYLKSDNEEYLSVQESVEEQGLIEGRNNGDGLELEKATIRVRMDIETNDYEEPGPNKRHVPPPAGRV